MNKGKGIPFASEMVQAIMRGQTPKTQTRRVLVGAPHKDDAIMGADIVGNYIEFAAPFVAPPRNRVVKVKLPYRVNDVIYIKETYATGIEGCPIVGDYSGVTYRADHQDPRGDGPANPIKWCPSMFMPKALARTWLEVLAVRVERLQDISEEDAIAEGFPLFRPVNTVADYPRPRFMVAWDSINAKRGYSWESSPWVAVYTFRRMEP